MISPIFMNKQQFNLPSSSDEVNSIDSATLFQNMPVLSQFPTQALANLTPSHINNLKFADILGSDDISYIKDSPQANKQFFLPSQGKLYKSIIITGDNSSSSQNVNTEGNKQQDDSSSAYSLINEEQKTNGNGSTSNLSFENTEQFRQAELKVIERFVEKRTIETSAINEKYQNQISQLEARGVNPLTKKLIEKVNKEWSECLQSKL